MDFMDISRKRVTVRKFAQPQRILCPIVIWADIENHSPRPVFITKYQMDRGK